MPSAVTPPASGQHQQHPGSESSFSKLKYWFNKGVEMHGDNKASHQAKRKQQKDMDSARYVAGPDLRTADGAATRPYPSSPRGPRLSPQAVHVEARSNSSEGDNVPSFSSLGSSPASSLTSAQSHVPLEQSQRSKPKNPKPGTLPISFPQPRQSLLSLAANYPDVQNPRRANSANKKPTAVADIKPAGKQHEQRSTEFRPDKPVKEVPKGRGQVITPPTHQRSQKTVVRKMEPQRAPGTDNHFRQVYRETRFEDFMGKDSPSIMPPLPANVAGLAAPNTSANYRLSRPFAAAEPMERFVDENSRPGTASTAALSVSDSRAQTWLRYDHKHGEPVQAHGTDAPLFPRRKPVVPNQDQQSEYNPCQTCKRQVHPSTAFSYNGTYLCEDCAATGRWGDKKKESLRAKKTKVSRKPNPKTSVPSSKEKHTPASTLSTSSTLRGSLSPRIPPRQPSNEQGFLQSPKPSSPAPSNAPSSTFTPSPLSPYFATPNPVGKYPRYRTPPPPPIITTDSALEQRLTPPPDSPLRKPKPASSIYPSTPWRLSRPPSIPSIPAVPEKYLYQEVEKTHERDTIYRAEIEEDIIDSYAVDSPVSPLSDRGNDVVEDNGTYFVFVNNHIEIHAERIEFFQICIMNGLPNNLKSLSLLGAGFTLGFLVKELYRYRRGHDPIIPSPRETLLPYLSSSEIAKLPYPPDALPGARDIPSPHGSLRVYEWGPENGRRVLMIHGISTPSIALDLPGRGYSSTPSPSINPQTSDFFVATILFVLASSPISWTGTNRFSILGYSLGGGIALNFASCFPDLISSVILLAPSGLIRPYHFGWQSRLLYSSRLLPDWVIEPLVYWKLSNSSRPDEERSGSAIEDDFSLTEQGGDEIVSRSRFDVPMALEWQVRQHKGYVKSNISSLQHAPISGQHNQWLRMIDAFGIQDNNVFQQMETSHAAEGARILIISGENDPIIIAKELEEDSRKVLGEGLKSMFVNIPGAGHDFPITCDDEVVDTITKFWQR
ncbi:MAG: hypothetical protein Q9215_007084 [Flavoplaca cf. flavocitrina]